MQSFDLVGELAYNEIHKLAERNNWQEGCAEKNALHALVGGIMSELTGNGFLAGASASTVNEMVQKKLSEQFEGEPDKHQWASAIIGGVVSQLVAGKAQAGASTAASGTKNNYLFRDQIELKERELSEAIARGASDEEIKAINDKWDKIDQAQDEAIDALGYPIGNIADGSIENDYEAKKSILKYAQDKLFADEGLITLKKALGDNVSSMAVNIVDGKIKNTICQNLKNNIKINANAQGLPNLNYVVDIAPGSSIIMKGVAEVGVVNIAGAAYSCYLDSEKYTNIHDLATANSYTLVGVAVSAVAGMAISATGAPLYVVLISGAVVGYLVDEKISVMKKEKIGY